MFRPILFSAALLIAGAGIVPRAAAYEGPQEQQLDKSLEQMQIEERSNHQAYIEDNAAAPEPAISEPAKTTGAKERPQEKQLDRALQDNDHGGPSSDTNEEH